MLLDQLNHTRSRIQHILNVLKETHAFEFPMQDPEQWPQLLEHYAQVQKHIQNTQAFNSYHQDPLYARAVLITEAVRMLLEIAPRRMRKKVKESHQPQETSMPQINEKAKKAKPDFLDVDGDGDKEESFKKALKDKEKAHKLDEKWDADMKTAAKDVGKWEGYTIAELKARKKRLMDKAERSAAEQKEVRQINFAIRAKQENSWGKIKQESVIKEFEETIPSDDAFDKIKQAGGQSVKTTTNSISFVTKTGRHELPHHEGPDGDRYVKVKDLNKALKTLNAPLMEDANLDQAETLLAAKDLSDRLQDMAEDAAKMAVDRLMPLVDTMKSQFGQPAAEGFNSVVKAQLQTVLDTIVAAKDATDNAIMALQSGETPVDQTTPDIAADLTTPAAEPARDDGEGEEIDFEKEFAAVPAASGPEQEPLGRARKTEVTEAKKGKMSPYAIGMAKAQELTGDEPPLKKSTIKKAHEIARAVEKGMHEQLTECTQHMRKLVHEYQQLKSQLQEHQVEFKSSGAPDLLGLGRGWQGDQIVLEMRKVKSQIQNLRAQAQDLKTQIQEQTQIRALTESRIQQLQTQIQHTPYGVTGVNHQGVRVRQFFESVTARDMWLDYHKDSLKSHDLIDPDRIQQVQEKLTRTLRK